MLHGIEGFSFVGCVPSDAEDRKFAGALMVLFLTLVCIFGSLSSLVMLKMARTKGILPAGMLSGLISIGTLLIVVPEYGSLASGNSQDVLEQLGGYSLTSILNVTPGAMQLLALCLIMFIAGEALVVSISKGRPDQSQRIPKWGAVHSRYFVILAMILGTAARFALSGQKGGTLTGRGTQSGLGFLTTSNWLLVCAIIILVEDRRCFTKPVRFILVAYCGIVTLLSFTRSPILLVVCYLTIRGAVALARRRISIRFLISAAAVSYVVMILVSVISQWRGAKIRHLSFSLFDAVTKIAGNPVTSLPTSANVNTFDGTIFTRLLQGQGVRGSPRNWAVAITTFVPSQIWPGKPSPLSLDLSARYLHFGASGIFLSGAGFASMTLYGTVGAMLAWFAMAVAVTLFLRRGMREPFDFLWCSLGVFLIVTLWFEGDAFNIYYTFTIVIVSWFCLWLARGWIIFRSKQRHRLDAEGYPVIATKVETDTANG